MGEREANHGELAWLDGRFVPRDGFGLPPGDAGFVLGVTVVEQLRTFHGRLFEPDAHAARLRESLAVLGLQPGWSVAEIVTAAAELAAHNHALPGTPSGADLGVVIFVTPGDLPAQHGGRRGRPRTVVHSFPLAFRTWAHAYDQGLALRTVGVLQVPEGCWPTRVKVRSRLHYYLADREADAAEPGARAVLRHADGRISETSTANLAVVRDGAVCTPPPGDALPGVSLAFTRTLALQQGIAWQERSLSAADVARADEVLLTSTPNCILPATRLDGHPIGTGRPGPVYRRLLDGWSRAVGIDVAAQARCHAAAVAPPGGMPA